MAGPAVAGETDVVTIPVAAGNATVDSLPRAGGDRIPSACAAGSLFFVDAPTKELLETPADGTGGTVLIAGPSADWETDAVTVSFAAGNAKGNSSGTEAGQMAAPPACNAGSPVAVNEPRKGLSGVALGRTRGAA